MKVKVIFYPEKEKVWVAPGTSLLEAASLAGVELRTACGGEGTCGRCRVQVLEGSVACKGGMRLKQGEEEQGIVLACQATVSNDGGYDLKVAVPQSSLNKEARIIYDSGEERGATLWEGFDFDPLARRVRLRLDEPSIVENLADLPRLKNTLLKELGLKDSSELQIGLPLLKRLAEVLRSGEWSLTATLSFDGKGYEVIEIEPGDTHGGMLLGLAVDIGTTNIIAYLLDLEKGSVLARQGAPNKQALYGDDVISRIIHATEKETGLNELHEAVIETINFLVATLLKEIEAKPQDICQVMIAGNTTMTHLFLGITPKYIRLEPYIPTVSAVPPIKAKEIGLHVHPEAYILSFPQVASYVGGDIVAGTLYNGLTEREGVVLFVDIGTNGEIVLSHEDWLVSCACSAGPAFEGGGIIHGMRAMSGAIERILIDSRTLDVQVKTIGGQKPAGICGSGLIDCLSKMRAAGIIDRSGKFIRSDGERIRRQDDGLEFILVTKEESASGEALVISESDIKNLIRAKAAVYAGIRTLFEMVGMDESVVDEVIIAGGFGSYLNIKDVIRIGLLPDLPLEKFKFVGNSAIKGACTALFSKEAYKKGQKLGQKMTYLELSVGNTFMEEFVSALFLPHTDLERFPSVTD